jgi:PLP dependent protein
MREKSLEDSRILEIEENIKAIRENCLQACMNSGRSIEEIKIMAVTKTVEVPYINHVIHNGINLIGENRVQEFLGKKDLLDLSTCEVHLIGHLQTNKVRQIVGAVTMIQSVDSIKIAEEIGKRSVEAGIITRVLMEINIAEEESKFGFSAVNAVEKAYELSLIKGIELNGIMSVPPICADEKAARQNFSNINRLFIDICDKKIDNVSMKILSMGMSSDYVPAIMEGSNLIRVGSAIFGSRKY